MDFLPLEPYDVATIQLHYLLNFSTLCKCVFAVADPDSDKKVRIRIRTCSKEQKLKQILLNFPHNFFIVFAKFHQFFAFNMNKIQ